MPIPRILLGTSPFIAAGQFGHRSTLYWSKFCLNPSNILEIIRKAYGLGVQGIQLLPHKPVVRAVSEALREGMDLRIVGSVGPGDIERDVELLKELGAVAIVAHGDIADLRDEKLLERTIEAIHEAGRPAGFASHQPFKTLNWARRLSLDYEIVMVPLNVLGAFMDSKPEDLVKLLEESEKFVIAKKVLAAGSLPPTEALPYVAGLTCVDSVALGISSDREAEETIALARSLFV